MFHQVDSTFKVICIIIFSFHSILHVDQIDLCCSLNRFCYLTRAHSPSWVYWQTKNSPCYFFTFTYRSIWPRFVEFRRNSCLIDRCFPPELWSSAAPPDKILLLNYFEVLHFSINCNSCVHNGWWNIYRDKGNELFEQIEEPVINKSNMLIKTSFQNIKQLLYSPNVFSHMHLSKFVYHQ